jgi:hypothetical protein
VPFQKIEMTSQEWHRPFPPLLKRANIPHGAKEEVLITHEIGQKNNFSFVFLAF